MQKLSAKILLNTFILMLVLSINIYGITYDKSNHNELENKIEEELFLSKSSIEIHYSGSISIESLQQLVKNVLNDNPYLNSTVNSFQLNITYTSSYACDIVIKPDYLLSNYEKTETHKKIHEILTEIIKPNMNDHEKVKAVHDYIVLHGQYDESFTYYSNYDLLFLGKSVCNGYALLTYDMLTELNIPVKLVFGNGNSQAHVWNMVKLNGYWFHLDSTWNDPTPNKINEVSYNYYMLTDQEILEDHTIDAGQNLENANTKYSEHLKSLSSSIDGYKYAALLIETELDVYNKENTASTTNELKDILNKKIQFNPSKISVRINSSVSENEILNSISNLYNYDFISKINYYPLEKDNTGYFNILKLIISYNKTPDKIITDFSNSIYNLNDTVNFNVYAVYGTNKINITKNVFIYPLNKNFINATGNTLTFNDAGSQNLKFEYKGKTTTTNITAINSKGLEYITNKKPYNYVNVKIFNSYIDFSIINQWPIIENGRTLVPLRAVFEVLNCDVKWDTENNSAIISKGNTMIVIPANKKTVYVNSKPMSLDVPAKIINGRIMVPLRFISESINKSVIWDDANKTVLIY